MLLEKFGFYSMCNVYGMTKLKFREKNDLKHLSSFPHVNSETPLRCKNFELLFIAFVNPNTDSIIFGVHIHHSLYLGIYFD